MFSGVTYAACSGPSPCAVDQTAVCQGQRWKCRWPTRCGDPNIVGIQCGTGSTLVCKGKTWICQWPTRCGDPGASNCAVGVTPVCKGKTWTC